MEAQEERLSGELEEDPGEQDVSPGTYVRQYLRQVAW